ncbi:hypothetical protein MKK58_22095 [Methylobacterium sp. J-078]|uniref:hypothetical protein n=1 Tax=Methylobacterium sp. J-078 TaxID=2836657 RepID=UPI001FB8B7A1|nr:hypothetical protein [Methylobacterium sp. J-078]MCJ2047205.1 hypothetical protein [Methylobacterium sp. J-078]
MKIAAVLALQSVPFAGYVFAGGENRDLFAVLYLSALGVVLTLSAIFGDGIVGAADLVKITEALTTD